MYLNSAYPYIANYPFELKLIIPLSVIVPPSISPFLNILVGNVYVIVKLDDIVVLSIT
jgi:hypothetical protein